MRLKEIREARGISQRQAALGLNLSPTVYNRYENGIREPSNAMMLMIADYFGVTVDQLLGRDPLETDQRAEDAAPRTIEARIVSFAMDKLPQEDREKLLAVIRAMYSNKPELFEKKGDNEHDA